MVKLLSNSRNQLKKLRFSRLAPQPLTAIVTCLLALLALTWAWADAAPTITGVVTIEVILLALFLSSCIVQAGLYPVHIRYHTKVTLTTPPMYLVAVLLPPPLACLSAGLATLILQLITRSQRGNLPSDIATAVGRWMIIGLLGALIAHLPTHEHLAGALVLVGAAAMMFAADVFTCAFEISPMSGEPPVRIMKALIREGGLFESVQYLLGMLGAFAAFQQVWALGLLILPTIIVYLAFKNAKEMHDGTRQVLEGLADAVDLRDPYTSGHSRRVAEWSAHILKELNISGPEAELIKASARVHDIGKVGVPDEILNKPGKLTPEEKLIMDSHPTRGAELLARYPDFARGKAIVRHHHERWDGQGYPSKLKSLDIPFGARVIAVADSFDAMTSNRPYRASMTVSRAVRILREGRAQQWDPAIVDALLRCIAKAQEQPMAHALSTLPISNPIAGISI